MTATLTCYTDVPTTGRDLPAAPARCRLPRSGEGSKRCPSADSGAGNWRPVRGRPDRAALRARGAQRTAGCAAGHLVSSGPAQPGCGKREPSPAEDCLASRWHFRAVSLACQRANLSRSFGRISTFAGCPSRVAGSRDRGTSPARAFSRSEPNRQPSALASLAKGASIASAGLA